MTSFLYSLVLAQIPYAEQPVDIYVPVVTAPAAILAQGGAYIGVADGAAGIKFNPASVANRLPYDEGEWWNWDWNADFNSTGSDAVRTDYFNSGRIGLGFDDVTSRNASIDMQLGRVGFGVSFNQFKLQADPTFARVQTLRLAGGCAFGRGELVLGGALVLPRVAIEVDGEVINPEANGAALQVGALLRPAGENFRMGVSLQSRGRTVLNEQVGTDVGGRVVPPQLVVPWEIGLGAAYSFGSRPMNLQPSFGDDRIRGDVYESFARGHYQLALDIVLIGADSSAVGLDGWFLGEAQAVGRRVTGSIRVGFEGEVIEDLLVLRAGSYIEPSRFAETSDRLHGTMGFDVHVFDFIWQWRFGVAIDAARDLGQLALSVGFWH